MTKLKIQSPAIVQSNSGWYTVVREVHLVELLMRLALTLLQKCHDVIGRTRLCRQLQRRIMIGDTRNHMTGKLDKNYMVLNILD